MLQFGQNPLKRLSPGRWTIEPQIKEQISKEEKAGLSKAAKMFSWIETYLNIRTKKGDLRKIQLNTIQEILAQYIAYCWAVKLPVRIILPKSRQMGSSTFFQALFFALCELKKGYHVHTVAHDEAGATEIFGKSKTFYREMETGWPIYLLSEQRNRMDWEHHSSNSAATIKTGDALGKGYTLNAIHFSESANFSDKGTDADNAEASILSAIHQDEMSIIVHESTAKGRDPFYYPKCEAARTGKNDFQLIFLPWFLEEGYKRTWEQHRNEALQRGKADPGETFKPSKEERELCKLLKEQEVRKHERFYRYNTELTEEQLVWRRWSIENKCQGKLDLFQRYYPSTYEEAFTASTNCMFKEDTIEFYRGLIQLPGYTGTLKEKPNYKGPPRLGFEFKEKPRNISPLKIWEMPIETERYVVGADPGGSNAYHDANCAYVLKRRNMEVVAQVYGNMEWETFSDLIESVSLFYNEALLAVENNFNRAICSRLHSRGRCNLYYYQDMAVLRIGREKTPGFNMNARTRPEVLSVLEHACRTKAVYCRERGFVREMTTFVWVPKKGSQADGKYMAVGSNKDDRIMAMAIAVYMCPRADWTHNPIPEAENKPTKHTRAYAKFLELQATESKEGESSPLSLF